MTDCTLHTGDCREVLAKYPDGHFTAVVTDPPYGLNQEPDMAAVLRDWLAGREYEWKGCGFMGKVWDAGVPGPDVWREVFRVMKPGAHLLCFAGARTQDLMGISLRLAGFEIRDCVQWVFGSGFPKSHDVSKSIDRAEGAEREVVGQKLNNKGDSGVQRYAAYGDFMQSKTSDITAPATDAAKKWNGYGSALKPAYEPVLLCRKPLDGTIAGNCLAHGCGGLNVDGCRISAGGPSPSVERRKGTPLPKPSGVWPTWPDRTKRSEYRPAEELGRFPANFIHDGSDEVVGLFPVTCGGGTNSTAGHDPGMWKCKKRIEGETFGYADTGSAARFFYCAKVSAWERNAGLEGLPERKGGNWGEGIGNASGRDVSKRNTHPTVKPIALMRYLIRLISPPGGAILLDPFTGSGSTGCAAVLEGAAEFHGMDLDPEHIDIAERRIAYWQGMDAVGHDEETARKTKAGEVADGSPRQMALFG